MADIDNELQKQTYALIDTLNLMVEGGNATVFQIADIKNQLQEILKELPVSEVRQLKKDLDDNNEEVKDAIKEADKYNKERIKAEEEYQKKIKELTDKIEEYNSIISEGNSDASEIAERKRQAVEKELNDAQAQHQAQMESNEAQYKARQEIEKEQNENIKRLATEREKQINDSIDKVVNATIGKFTTDIINRFQNAVNSNTNFYEQNSGKLAAILNTTTEDIGNLQRKIAKELQDASLSKAISNIEVMTEASRLVSAGYSNEETLQARATAFAEARKIAPTLDIDSTTIRNLSNVLGPDFTLKFAAIQTAVQDTAGSTAFLNSNLSKMIDDLSPVIQSAENDLALQGVADVEASLESAIAKGDMSKEQAQEYSSMIAELMDPSRAMKSSQTAVRVAMQNYDYSSSDPYQAFLAIQQAQQQMYGNIGMGSSSAERIGRSLAMAAYGGTTTMSATYMPTGLYDFETKRTADLGQTAEEQIERVGEGDYTTRQQELSNLFENSSMAQGISKIAQNSPLIYGILSGIILASINSLPTRIASAMKGFDLLDGFKTKDLGNTIGGTMSGKLATAGKALGKSALALGATTAAIYTVGQYDPHKYDDEGSTEGGTAKEIIATAGHQGNYLSSAISLGLIGAQIGSFGGPVGTGIGAIVGIAGGLITAGLTRHFDKTAEKLEENTKALENSTGATKGLSGSITALDSIEAKREIARGGGIVSTKSGDYKIDYTKSTHAGFATGLDFVPYDDFIFRAHKGEAIVTAEAAAKLRQRDPNFWNTPMLNEDTNIVGALREQTESIVNAVSGDKQYAPLTKVGPQQYTIKNAFT